MGQTSKKVRRYSFRTPTLSLTELLDYTRTIHETEKQAKGIETTPNVSLNHYCHKKSEDVCKVKFERHNRKNTSPSDRFQRPRPKARDPTRTVQPPTSQSSKRCFRCGGTWPHTDEKCPAEGQQCNYCPKYNHFARVCNSRGKKQGQQNSANVVNDTAQDPRSSDSSHDEHSTDSEEYSFNVHTTNMQK